MFRKPIDRFEGLSDEEIEQKLEEFRANNFDEEEEKAMILAALRTLLPAVILVCIAFSLIFFLILAWIN